MQSTILIIFCGTLLYFFFGIGHTNTLRRNHPAFRKIIDRHPALYAVALITWPIVFIIYISIQSIEPLTKSRKDDYPDDEDLPEFLKRQSD